MAGAGHHGERGAGRQQRQRVLALGSGRDGRVGGPHQHVAGHAQPRHQARNIFARAVLQPGIPGGVGAAQVVGDDVRAQSRCQGLPGNFGEGARRFEGAAVGGQRGRAVGIGHGFGGGRRGAQQHQPAQAGQGPRGQRQGNFAAHAVPQQRKIVEAVRAGKGGHPIGVGPHRVVESHRGRLLAKAGQVGGQQPRVGRQQGAQNIEFAAGPGPVVQGQNGNRLGHRGLGILEQRSWKPSSRFGYAYGCTPFWLLIAALQATYSKSCCYRPIGGPAAFLPYDNRSE